MSFSAHETAVSTVLAGWTASPIYGPRVNVTQPPPSGNPDSPASYLVWQLEYEVAEQLTYGGTEHAKGDVVVGIFTETDLGDSTIHMDALKTLFASASPQVGYTWLPEFAQPGPEEEVGAFFGREFRIPFHVFEEPA